MTARALVFFLFVAASWTAAYAQTPACCPANGIWSEWATLPGAVCPTNCGGCTTMPATRKCHSEADGCPCTGDKTKDVPCERSMCNAPKTTCCVGKKTRNLNIYRFVCGTENFDKQSADGCCLPTIITAPNGAASPPAHPYDRPPSELGATTGSHPSAGGAQFKAAEGAAPPVYTLSYGYPNPPPPPGAYATHCPHHSEYPLPCPFVHDESAELNRRATAEMHRRRSLAACLLGCMIFLACFLLIRFMFVLYY